MTLNDVLINSNKRLSNEDQGKLFTTLQADKNACKRFMNQIIESSLVSVSQQMGLQIPYDNTKATYRLCLTFCDVGCAIKSYDIFDINIKAAAIHFLTVYWRDTLYPSILKTTHQHETEKAFIAIQNIKLTNNHLVSNQNKTCIASMYGECFNDIKQKMNRSIFAKSGLSVSVASKYVEQEKNYKRGKNIFFINDKLKKTSTMVRIICIYCHVLYCLI